MNLRYEIGELKKIVTVFRDENSLLKNRVSILEEENKDHRRQLDQDSSNSYHTRGWWK